MMDRESLRIKREQFKRDMFRVSEEKNRKLFEKDSDRDAWVKVIRKSVEKEIESRVREALGTPPKERQRKRLEEQTAKRLAKIEEEKKATARSILQKQAVLEIQAEDDELLWLRRQKYLEKFNRRRTMREIPSPTLRSITSRRYSSLSPKDSENPPIVWESCETVPSQIFTCATQFKRAVTESESIAESAQPQRTGPFFPSGRMPCMSTPLHLNCVPSYIEDLNSPEANENSQKFKEHPDYPKCWKGSVVVFDTERKNILDADAVPPGCPPHLQFESRFECGNLRQAKRVGNYEYEVVLNTDLYTRRHTQWYYFQVRKTIPGVTYTFTIINLLKRDSLYNHGMKPLFYSEKNAERKKMGWTRRGHHIKYYQNYIKGHSLLSRDKIYFSLTFQMEFPHVNDVCYLTHCYPYTYSDLENYLQTITSDPIKYRFCKQQVLCKTIAGNNCHLLTITSEDSSEDKLGVVVTARVHPGETNASWMMKGLLDFLTSNDPVAENLRRKHVFKIIPMLNPDGVIVGNYRTNLAAKDLNRTYVNPRKDSSPTVYHAKKLVEFFSSEQEIVIYCDLHGHSRKPNVFMYGCTPDSGRGASVKDFVQERLFPWLMSKKAPDHFSFRECKFKVRKCKEGTARVVMWRQMGVANSFTMEATFCGANFGDIAKGRHFHSGDFEAMGRHFCEVLMDYTTARPNGCRSEITEAFVEMASRMTQDIVRHARLLQQRKNETCCSAEGRMRQSRESHSGDVNVFDIHVGSAQSAEEFQEVEVSVRRSEGTSFEDCLKQLEDIDINELRDESDSSDSDSESDAEDTKYKQRKHDSGRKKKRKKKAAKRWEVLASLKQRSELQNEEKEQTSKRSPKESRETKRIRLNQGTFVNPYITRFNNGIPIYSQERIEERTRKKNQDTPSESEPSTMDLNPLPLLREDEMELYNVPQRNLAFYMMSRGPSTTPVSRAQVVGVDTFKFESLSASTSKGFTVRIPGRGESAVRSDDDTSRWNPENMLEDISELYYGDQNPSMRKMVTLNPLHSPQSTACAYDLAELSKTGHDFAHKPMRDWDQGSHGHTQKASIASLYENIPRSETKLRSLQKLKQLSLDDKTARHDILQ